MSTPSRASVSAMDWLAYFASRLGAPGWLGVILLLGALAGWGLVVRPLAADAESLDAQGRALAARAAGSRAARPEAAPAVAAKPLAERLPDTVRGTLVIADLFAAAKKSGLELDEGNYRMAADSATGVVRQQISLPLIGDYPALRGFIAAILARHPSLVLDGLSLSREGPGTGELEAEVRLTLYLREGA